MKNQASDLIRPWGDRIARYGCGVLVGHLQSLLHGCSVAVVGARPRTLAKRSNEPSVDYCPQFTPADRPPDVISC